MKTFEPVWQGKGRRRRLILEGRGSPSDSRQERQGSIAQGFTQGTQVLRLFNVKA